MVVNLGNFIIQQPKGGFSGYVLLNTTPLLSGKLPHPSAVFTNLSRQTKVFQDQIKNGVSAKIYVDDITLMI